MYQVKEIFATLQGEGFHAGRAAVFCRFAGCNLWTGRERDRETAVCRFCDTDFVGTDGPGGGKFDDAQALAAAIAAQWQAPEGQRFTVLTGGEPLLQVDAPLIAALHRYGFEIAVETNGTIEAPAGIDWLCVSPKAGAGVKQRAGDELKLVYPQEDCLPTTLGATDFKHYYLQPMDGPDWRKNVSAAVAYCAAHPRWRLSLQTHKLIGIP